MAKKQGVPAKQGLSAEAQAFARWSVHPAQPLVRLMSEEERAAANHRAGWLACLEYAQTLNRAAMQKALAKVKTTV